MARRSGDDSILALAFFRLAEAKFRRRTHVRSAIRNAREAVRLYRSLGDAPGQARALWALGSACNDAGESTERDKALRESLALARRAGDLYGLGNALNGITFGEADLAELLRLRKECRDAFEAAGYVERQATSIFNLGILYARMGLWRRARRLIIEANALSARSGGGGSAMNSAFALSRVEAELGHLDAARAAVERGKALLQTDQNPLSEGFLSHAEGDLELSRGNAGEAERRFAMSVDLFRKAHATQFEIIILPFLALARLATGNARGALEASRRAARIHEERGFPSHAGIESGTHIWWAHHEALRANGKHDEARKALETAYKLVVRGITTLSDEGLRRSVLCHVRWHRKIVRAWIEDPATQRIPARRRHPHLAGKASLREPFERLADTGLRLNEIRGVEELYEFLIDEAMELCGAERVVLVLERPEGPVIAGSAVPQGERADALLEAIQPDLDEARRTRAALLAHGPDGVPAIEQRSRIVAPLIAQHEIVGYLYGDIDGAFGRFNESDRDLIGMLASQGAVALANARWSEGLEAQVTQRTQELSQSNAQLEQRASELAIINSVQEGLASHLDIDAIFALVGDKIGEIFAADTTYIAYHDVAEGAVVLPYYVDAGETPGLVKALRRSRPYGKGLTEIMIESGKPLLLGTAVESESLGSFVVSSPGAQKDMNESFLGVPLFRQSRAYGAVSVQSYKRHAYDENDLRLLTTLASAMSVALENARLFGETQLLLKETEQRAAELAVINSIQQGVAGSLDFQGIVELVGGKLREVLHTEDIGIRWYEHDKKLTHYLYEVEHGKRLSMEPRAIAGAHEQMIANRQPVIHRNFAEANAAGHVSMPGTDQSKSLATVPIVGGDRVLGSIIIESFEKEDAFGESEIRLLQTVAASMGVALENARLFNETQRLLKETEQRNAELAVINSIQQGMAGSLDFQGIVDLVGDKLREVLQTQDIGIRWFDTKNRLVHYLYEYEHGKRLEVPPTQLKPDGRAAQMMATRKASVFGTPEEMVAAGTSAIAGTDQAKSAIFVPIIGSDRVIGSILLENHEREHAYGESDQRLLTTVASSMGVALENARLFDETQRLFKESEQRAAELAIINSVQQALAAELNIQGIYDAVGDKVREIFDHDDLEIRIFDDDARTVHFVYLTENGKRITLPPLPIPERGFAAQIRETGKTLVINENMAGEMEKT
ncbi:MAG TPA: GAF domain-containing protein, partial [Usitatibacter sp.]